MDKILPIFFAILWSTGFIGAKYGLPYIEAYSFLSIRFAITLSILGVLILVLKPEFPKEWKNYLHIFVSGIFIHVAYLGGVFTAIQLGLAAGITAVLVGLQPVLTTLILNRLNSVPLLLISFIGFIGLVLVVYNDELSNHFYRLDLYIPVLIALLGITVGTIYLKNNCSEVNNVTIAFLQYIPTFLIFTGMAFIWETDQQIKWGPELIFALLWLSIILSVGAVILMSELYKRNSANVVSNYFYLAPPFTLIQGFILFNEEISLINMVGITLIILSVYMAGSFTED